MKKRRRIPAILIVLPIILVILIVVVIIAGKNISDKKRQSQQTETQEAVQGSSAQEPESVQSAPQTMTFVDAHKNSYEMVIDPNVEKHPYDLNAFSNDGTICTYEDAAYTSRRGIDVSEYQGIIDWQAAADSGIQFAFIRLGYRGYGPEGTIVLDTLFETNYQGARAAGIDVGAYFFSQAVSVEEAAEEAQICLNALSGRDLQLPVVFDSENILDDTARTDNVTGTQFTDNAIAFCEQIKASGYEAAIYSNLKWEAFTYDLTRLTAYPIWYADYEPLPQTPYRFTWWQYSETGTVPGVSVPVDLNIQMIKK